MTNYQALPTDASFTDASGIRLGTQEMTRFGMKEPDFAELASVFADILLRDASCSDAVRRFRSRFVTMEYAFEPSQRLISSLVAPG